MAKKTAAKPETRAKGMDCAPAAQPAKGKPAAKPAKKK